MDFDKKANRNFFNKQLLYKTGGILVIIIILALIIADFRIYKKKRELALQITAYQKRVEELKKSNQTLNEEIANADNVDYLEKIAYEQLGQQRPGEREIIFVTTPQESPKADVGPQKFWQNFTGWLSQSWSWIKNKF